VFAVALALLRRSDAYARVVEEWPPTRFASGKAWELYVGDVGARWRRAAGASAGPPREVASWWATIARAFGSRVSDIRRRRSVYEALLQLVAAADEACAFAGIWDAAILPDAFGLEAMRLLLAAGTLGRELDRTRGVVFPKMHTPQRGITSRSLTHYVALHETRDVVPRWSWIPHRYEPAFSLNLLLLPWPEVVEPGEFSETGARLRNMRPERFGFFTWRPRTLPVRADRVEAAFNEARRRVGRIDAIVFPEMALAPRASLALCKRLGVTVIGGEGRPARSRRAGENRAVVAVPVARGPPMYHTQAKHHRWRLDDAQIRQYGLGGRLDPTRDWWEHIDLEKREVWFFSVNSWLNFSVLICEDLARQDPVAELLRAVGPNLVLALLMDGPQLQSRWPAKYATVLAEDPGSSVLTLTSLGMARSSRPPGMDECRVVGIWKDATGPAVEILLPRRAAGTVLSLTRDMREEHTADGRSDGGQSGYLRLHGVHHVFLDGAEDA
jgi:hypothetical protein